MRRRPRRPRSTAALLICGAGVAPCACEPITRELGFDLVVPEDSDDYERADNASVTIEPDGATGTWAVDGLDFSLDIEVDPSDDPRTMSVFLADGEDLIAWGKSPVFVTGGANVGIAIFLGRPGRLSTFPGQFETPDPEQLATRALGRGMLGLSSKGETALLSEIDLETQVGATLDDPPPIADGGLYTDPAGGALRLAFEGTDGWMAARYDPPSDTWTALDVDGAPPPRPGAAVLEATEAGEVWLIGGGDQSDGLEVDLLPNEGTTLATSPLSGLTLDDPRRGATAAWFQRPDEPAGFIVFGGDRPALPLVFVHPDGATAGETGSWTGAACAQLDDVMGARVLCLGGIRDGQPTADAVVISLPAGAPPEVSVLLDLLPVPMEDPLLLPTEGALYAQGEGRLVRVSRNGNLEAPAAVQEVDAPSTRANGGHSVLLGTGATFLAGGWAVDGSPIDQWEVFLPEPPSTPAE